MMTLDIPSLLSSAPCYRFDARNLLSPSQARCLLLLPRHHLRESRHQSEILIPSLLLCLDRQAADPQKAIPFARSPLAPFDCALISERSIDLPHLAAVSTSPFLTMAAVTTPAAHGVAASPREFARPVIHEDNLRLPDLHMPRAPVLMRRSAPRRTSSTHSGLNPAFASNFAAGSSRRVGGERDVEK